MVYYIIRFKIISKMIFMEFKNKFSCLFKRLLKIMERIRKKIGDENSVVNIINFVIDVFLFVYVNLCGWIFMMKFLECGVWLMFRLCGGSKMVLFFNFLNVGFEFSLKNMLLVGLLV